ncbi:MAG: HD domain-containing protein [Candidatus Gracilibacteria bacterium]|jgi:(p)ppGpp synthase/HD superfamily hydrolase
MNLTQKIQNAINTAAHLHDGQERKADGLPYIVHPFTVALILMNYTADEDVIIAGILHDTIEDTPYTKEQMEEAFGPRVTSLVTDLTELPKTFSWQERKDSYLKHLETTSHESKLICAADKIHNLQSMLDAFRKFGEKANEKFNAPADKKLWFYEECLKIFKNDEQMPTQIIQNMEDVLKELRKEMALL